MEQETIKNYPSILFCGDGVQSLIRAVAPNALGKIMDCQKDLIFYPLSEGECFMATKSTQDAVNYPFPIIADNLSFAWYFCLDNGMELSERVGSLHPDRIVVLDVYPWGNRNIKYDLRDLVYNMQDGFMPPLELQLILLKEDLKYGYTDMSSMEQALYEAKKFYEDVTMAVHVREYSLGDFDAASFEEFLTSGRGFVSRFLALQDERLRMDSEDFQKSFLTDKERCFTNYNSDTAILNKLFSYGDEMKNNGCCKVLQQRLATFLDEHLKSEIDEFLEHKLQLIYNESREAAFIGEILNGILQDLQPFYWQDNTLQVSDVLDYHDPSVHEKRLRLQQGLINALDNVPEKLKTYIEQQYEENLHKITKLRGRYNE